MMAPTPLVRNGTTQASFSSFMNVIHTASVCCATGCVIAVHLSSSPHYLLLHLHTCVCVCVCLCVCVCVLHIIAYKFSLKRLQSRLNTASQQSYISYYKCTFLSL